MVKRYKVLKYIFKDSIEVYEYLDGKYGAPGEKRQKKKKPTKEQIQKRNQWNRERKARHKLKTWFHVNDYFVTLTYRREARPPDMKTAKAHFREVYRYMQREYRKRGYELRWMRNIEVGSRGAWHIHMVVNRIPDIDLILRKAWKHGGVHMQLIYESWEGGQFAKLAEYMTKTPDTDPRLKESSYSTSKNLPTPEPKVKRVVYWKKEPKAKKGYYIDKTTFHEGVNPVTGYKYRYYTMVKLDRRI